VTVALPDEDRFLSTRAECVDRLAMMMAGRAAEEVVFGEFTTGAADDLARAAALARQMVSELGMAADSTEDSLWAALPPAAGAEPSERAEEAARALVEGGYLRAREIVEAHIDTLHVAATRLLEVEALEREEISELLGPRPQAPRLAVSQA
jgi:cell division protease FtsH